MNDLLLLSTLLAGPKHGYALKKMAGLITGQGEIHNNLVYPLLKRFVEDGLVSRKTASGERGQTREVYALTAKGRQELVARLGDFSKKDAANPSACVLRVGLFSVLPQDVRLQILDTRDKWLAEREQKLTKLREAMDVGLWGGESVQFLLGQIKSEREWLGRLRKKAKRG
jgi:DNA-binding PadR family transcriptional regulator